MHERLGDRADSVTGTPSVGRLRDRLGEGHNLDVYRVEVGEIPRAQLGNGLLIHHVLREYLGRDDGVARYHGERAKPAAGATGATQAKTTHRGLLGGGTYRVAAQVSVRVVLGCATIVRVDGRSGGVTSARPRGVH